MHKKGGKVLPFSGECSAIFCNGQSDCPCQDCTKRLFSDEKMQSIVKALKCTSITSPMSAKGVKRKDKISMYSNLTI